MKCIPLAARLADHTRELILGSAIALLEAGESVAALTIRGVARHVNISERTVFRYFATRDAFLDAVVEEQARRLDLPPAPRTLDELRAFPALLYRRFEAHTALVKAGLHTELYSRLRIARARERGLAVRRLIDAHAPAASGPARKIATTNIRHFLSATTWHYYRFYFGLSPAETVACAETAVRQAIAGLAAAV